MSNPDELRERISEFDQWVTSLVDLIPTSIYIPTDITQNGKSEKLSKAEKRRRRLDPDTCLTTSMKALMTMEKSDESESDEDDQRESFRPSDLKEKFAAKMKEIQQNQKRDLPRTPRTVEEQLIVSQKRKAERERKKLKNKTKVKKIIDESALNGSTCKSPIKDAENGKVIFNKFDLIKDPIQAEKERLKKKKPIQIRIKEAEAREAKLDELDDQNPDKADELREKKKWKDAITRVKGDKVRDDANLLKKSLKRQQQKKAASTKKWGARTEKVNEKMKAKQEKRKTNIKARSMKKKDNKVKKRISGKKTPGF